MPSSSATDDAADPQGLETGSSLGRAFVEALAAKDFERLAALLDPQIEFRGLTPGRAWEATDRDGVVQGVLRHWFEDSDEIEQVIAIETDSFADRQRVGYRLQVRNPDGQFNVEQQAYYMERDAGSTGCACSARGSGPTAATDGRRLPPLKRNQSV